MTVVVIPVRLGSRRVPRKALAPIGGLPLVEHVRRRAVEADVGRVVVATDSEEVAAVVRGFGGEARLTGPAENGTRRVASLGLCTEVILNVQGDQPGLDPEHVRVLEQAVRRHRGIATLSTPLQPVECDDPAVVKVWTEGGRATEFSRIAAPGAARHLGLYGFTRDALQWVTSQPVGARARSEGLEQLTWLEAGAPIWVASVERARSAVDTLAQLAALRRAWEG